MQLIKTAAIIIHPVFNHAFSVINHPEGELLYLGDALGCDCILERFVDGWMRRYENNGLNNEDWYGWGSDVLAPFDGVVESIHINPITNTPGNINKSRASSITFIGENNVRVCFAHIMDVCVDAGDAVRPGDVVAKVGNNGYSRHPHIHIGAWKNNQPLQIKFDLTKMGEQLKAEGERYHL